MLYRVSPIDKDHNLCYSWLESSCWLRSKSFFCKFSSSFPASVFFLLLAPETELWTSLLRVGNEDSPRWKVFNPRDPAEAFSVFFSCSPRRGTFWGSIAGVGALNNFFFLKRDAGSVSSISLIICCWSEASRGATEISRTALNLPQLLRCSFSNLRGDNIQY